MKNFLICCAIFIAVLPLHSFADTTTIHTLRDFEQAVTSGTTEKDKVLVVFDIDDTLLTSSQFYGGDSWYNWQRGKPVTLDNGKSSILSRSDQVTCIFDRLAVLYQFGEFELTEADAAKTYNDLASQFDVLLLTSRSPAYRQGTERELKRNGFKFAETQLTESGDGLAYDFSDGRYTAAIVYSHGVAMTTGLNKGLVLIDLLKRLDRTYTKIFFVDDGKKNITDMTEAWSNMTTQVQSYHFQGVSKQVTKIELKNANKSTKALNRYIQFAYPERMKKYRLGQCD